MQVIECTYGHYDVEEVEFGTVYRWCPECVVVECDCGERPSLTPSECICPKCGAGHTSIVQQELVAHRVGDETIHPWRYVGDRQDVGLPC